MKLKKLLSFVLSVAMAAGVCPVLGHTASAEDNSMKFNFTGTAMEGYTQVSEPVVYTQQNTYGFVAKTGAMPERSVDPSRIQATADGFTITETAETTMQATKDHYNYGGMVFRQDLAPGAYHIEVTVTGDKNDTEIAPTGMQAGRLTGTSPWDSAGLVARNSSARWNGSTWSYDYVSGNGFVEIEIEPKNRPSAGASAAVGLASISITPLAQNTKAQGETPTVFILGDSTVKSYTFEEAGMSGWGQVLGSLFDTSRVNVVNYSMGGRSFKAMYTEGRTNDVLMTGKPGDYVLVQSGHNDDSWDKMSDTGEVLEYTGGVHTRFGRGADAESYQQWIDIYVEAIRSRGMIPVLVTPMTRVNGGETSGDKVVFSKFGASPNDVRYPDLMKEKAIELGVDCVDLYEGSKAYMNEIGGDATRAMFMSIEAGETPGKTNSGSYANGHPDEKIDGTHFKEAMSKQFARIIVEDINALSGEAAGLKEYLSAPVKKAVAENDWSAVYPEIAADTQTGENSYYRNQIEKVLQLGLMSKTEDNEFLPKTEMTVGEFAEAMTKAWGLSEDALADYTTDRAAMSLMAAQSRGEWYATAAGLSLTDTAQITDGAKSYVDISVDGGAFTAKKGIAPGTPATHYISSATKPTCSGSVPQKVYNSGSSLILEAKATGRLYAVAKINANKYYYLADQETGQIQYCTAEVNTTSATDFFYEVKAGHTYRFYMDGTDGQLYGFTFEEIAEGYTIQETKATSGGSISVTVDGMGDAQIILASYDDNGALTEVQSEKLTAKGTYNFNMLWQNTKVMIWNSVSAMKPYAAENVIKPIPEPDFVEDTPINAGAVLTREAAAAILYDAYKLKFGDNKPVYMTAYNQAADPNDPNYDPNMGGGAGGRYSPLTDWFDLTDYESVSDTLYGKTKAAYQLGLIRTQSGIERGKIQNGTIFEPETKVSREQGAKLLYFAYVLGQDPKTENQALPEGNQAGNIKPREKYEINVVQPSEGGTISANMTKAYAGKTVTVTAELEQGYVLTEITVTADGGGSVKVTNASFTMPADNVTVTGTFNKVEAKVMLSSSKIQGMENFDNIRSAVARAEELNPQSEAERVTIQVVPGTYREQVVINTPYITLEKYGQSSEEVLLTWYYGIGYTYKSVDPATGLYNPDLAAGNGGATGKEPANWGHTLKIDKKATGFTAKNITLENSFNRYVTQEELDDLVTEIPKTNDKGENATKPNRSNLAPGSKEVQKNDYNERSAALFNVADRSAFYNCKIVSSQDTIGASGIGKRQYYENCYIEGRTDYICGEATAVFNNCDLMFYAYSDVPSSGTVTAAKTDQSVDYGYLFYNCRIGETNPDITKKEGSLGRPWSQSAQVTYYNTTYANDTSIIAPGGWGDMSSSTAKNARFVEYGSKYENGTPVNLSKRVEGTVADEWTILEYNPYNYLYGSDGWDPMGLAQSYQAVEKIIENTKISVPEGKDTIITLPQAPSGYEYKWEPASQNAIVNDDNTITVVRPAFGEEDIVTEITVYVRDSQGVGTRKVIPVTISATTDTENVFSVPVTITQSVPESKNVDYTVVFKKNGGVIKHETVTVPANQNTVTQTITNIPSGTAYHVEIQCEGDFTVIVPEDGKTSIAGNKGDSVLLSVQANKIVDETIATNIDYASNSQSGVTKYDLIQLAKEAGADASIDSSDIITVNYDLSVTSYSDNSFIDLTAGVPAAAVNEGANGSRYILTKINKSWNQVDTVDGSQGFDGSSAGPGQRLKIGEQKFTDNGNAYMNKPLHITMTIDYKNKTKSIAGVFEGETKGTDTYVFTSGIFPADAKGDVKIGIYPAGNTFTMKNVSVTYKKIVASGGTIEPDLPGEDTEPVQAVLNLDADDFANGRNRTNSLVYTFAADAPADAKALFADETDSETISSVFTANFKDYIGKGTNPTASKITIPAGTHKIYYIGKNSVDSTLTITGASAPVSIQIPANNGVKFGTADNSTDEGLPKELLLYTAEFTTEQAITNGTLTISNDTAYLPDIYYIKVVSNA